MLEIEKDVYICINRTVNTLNTMGRDSDTEATILRAAEEDILTRDMLVLRQRRSQKKRA